jgi:polysaccharide export outer membrane protein
MYFAISMRVNKILIPLLFCLTAVSCGYKNQKLLFKTEEKIETTKSEPVRVQNPQSYPISHHCQENDVLYVRLLNRNEETGGGYDKLASYREDAKFTVNNGHVVLPVVGKVNVLNLDRGEIQDSLTKLYSQFVVEPILDVEFANLHVTVLGEVEDPGKYQFEEGMHLVDALGLGGGFTDYSKFKDVRIIRGKGDKQEIVVCDITQIRVLDHPKLLLRHEDIIYVEPRRVKRFDTAVRPYLFLTSVISSFAAAAIIISRNR